MKFIHIASVTTALIAHQAHAWGFAAGLWYGMHKNSKLRQSTCHESSGSLQTCLDTAPLYCDWDAQAAQCKNFDDDDEWNDDQDVEYKQFVMQKCHRLSAQGEQACLQRSLFCQWDADKSECVHDAKMGMQRANEQCEGKPRACRHALYNEVPYADGDDDDVDPESDQSELEQPHESMPDDTDADPDMDAPEGQEVVQEDLEPSTQW